jgi:hypothetical protein
MPWYLVYARHGPGHQSMTSEVKWSEDELSDEVRKSLWEDVFGNCQYDWPVGDCIKLNGLPADVRKRMLEECRLEIADAFKRQIDLVGTPIIPHEPIDKESMVCVCGSHCYKCSKCGNIYCYTTQPDFHWCPDCMACQGGKHEWSEKAPIVCIKCGIEHPMEKHWAKQREHDAKSNRR